MGNSCRKPKHVDCGPSDPTSSAMINSRTPEVPKRKLKPGQVDGISNKNYLELPRQSYGGGGGHFESNQISNGTAPVQALETIEEKDGPENKNGNDQKVKEETVDTQSQNKQENDPEVAQKETAGEAKKYEAEVGHGLIKELEAQPEVVKVLEAGVAKDDDNSSAQKPDDIEKVKCEKMDEPKMSELPNSHIIPIQLDDQTPSLTEQAVHEMAQQCLLSHDDEPPVVSNEKNQIEKHETESKQKTEESTKNTAEDNSVTRAKFAETLATDILSSAQLTSHNNVKSKVSPGSSPQAERNGVSPSSPKSAETENVSNGHVEKPADFWSTMQKIHKICQQSLENDHQTENPILVMELEKEGTKSDLSNLIKNLKKVEADPSSENGLTHLKSKSWPPEMIDKLLGIHAEAQTILLEEDEPFKNEPTYRHPRLQGKNSGPKISVSFADGKAFLKAPPTTSLRECRVEEVEQALDAEARRKISIMNRRPTGPFLPQLDKVKFSGGMGMSLADEDEDEDEEEEAEGENGRRENPDEDDDDEGISFDIPIQRRASDGPGVGEKPTPEVEVARSRKLSELIAVFEEPKKSP